MSGIRQLQKEVAEFCKKNDWNATIEYYVLDLVSEVGELAKELILASNYGLKEPEFSANTELELGDCLFRSCSWQMS
jgi:NTP pyrophosphatase (non-canonical NTP hydrolase)